MKTKKKFFRRPIYRPKSSVDRKKGLHVLSVYFSGGGSGVCDPSPPSREYVPVSTLLALLAKTIHLILTDDVVMYIQAIANSQSLAELPRSAVKCVCGKGLELYLQIRFRSKYCINFRLLNKVSSVVLKTSNP